MENLAHAQAKSIVRRSHYSDGAHPFFPSTLLLSFFVAFFVPIVPTSLFHQLFFTLLGRRRLLATLFSRSLHHSRSEN